MKKQIKNITKILLMVFIIAIVCSFAFAAELPEPPTQDSTGAVEKVSSTTLWILKQVRIFSWPVCFLLLVLGFVNYYIFGSQEYDKKVAGKGMIIGAFAFIVIANVLPLIYVFIVGG